MSPALDRSGASTSMSCAVLCHKNPYVKGPHRILWTRVSRSCYYGRLLRPAATAACRKEKDCVGRDGTA